MSSGMEAPAASGMTRIRKDGGFQHNWVLSIFTAIMAVVLTLTLTVPVRPSPVTLTEGDVAKANIRAPRRVTYISQIKTKLAREAAAAAVAEVYDYDPGLAQRQHSLAASFFNGVSIIRGDSAATAQQKAERIQRLAEGTVTTATVSLILAVPDSEWPLVASEAIRVLDDIMRERIRAGDLPKIKETLKNRFAPSLQQDQLDAAAAIVWDLLRPNEVYNATETLKRRREAQDRVEPVRETVEKGEIVIREGNVVTALDLEKLEALGLRPTSTDVPEMAATAVMALLGVLVLVGHVLLFSPHLAQGDRRLLLVGTLVVLTVAMGRVGAASRLEEGVSWAFVVPYAAAAMLASIVVDASMALAISLTAGLLVGFTGERSLALAVYITVGSLVGALAIRRVDRLGAFLWAGFYVAIAQIAVIMAFFGAAPDQDMNSLARLMVLSVLSGGLSAATTATLFVPLGNIMGTITVFQLLELAQPSHPLFRRLIMEAPGTYHHSVIIGNLAERAAEAIGANSLLVRVGAYYHDIGKIHRPYFFIENQINGTNVHDRLDPRTSAQAVIAHVRDGVELARKYHLPRAIMDLIPQHHGTLTATYFYTRALEDKGQDGVREEDFRYPGPKPQTKEAAILMLADGVEAAVRASHDHSQENIERIVHEIITARLDEGQFSDCPLTLHELDVIRAEFSAVLQGVYHPRIEYPRPASPVLSDEGAQDRQRSPAGG
jgi:putative nucleotidyltransferase with HDIG domain